MVSARLTLLALLHWLLVDAGKLMRKERRTMISPSGALADMSVDPDTPPNPAKQMTEGNGEEMVEAKMWTATSEDLPWPAQRPLDVALTAVLTAGVDKQLRVQWHGNAHSLGSWPESVRNFKMHGVVLHDGGFSPEFIQNHSDQYVSFFDASHANMYQNSTWQNDWQGLTINDERFFVAGAFVEAYRDQLGYVLLTDSRDVTFGRDPFKLMRAMDKSMNTTFVYVQDEWRPNLDLEIPRQNLTAWERMRGYYHMCFGHDMPRTWAAGKMMNCGALGGHVTAMISLLRSMRANYAKVQASARPLMCDMPVVQRAVFEDFNDQVVSGYPFNGKFKHADVTEVAAVLHKSFEDSEGILRERELPYMDNDKGL